MTDVVFSVTPDAPDPGPAEMDVLRALVFRCGEYPDQQFALTEAEADALIADFAPVEARHGHPRSRGPLDGKMGTMTRLWREGQELFGLFAVPKWLTALIPPGDRKLSLGFDRAPQKRIAEWSWVVDPIISDAQLQAAFAAQQPPKESRPMSRIEEFMAWLRGETDQAPMPAAEAPPAPVAPVALEPAVDTAAQFAAQQQALETARAAFAAERATFAQQQYLAQATTAVDQLIAEGRVLPAENQPDAAGQPALVALFAQALADDATGTALFAQADGSRYAALTAVYRARPANPPQQERLPVTVLAADPTEKPPVDLIARRNELLATSPLGQRALQMQKES
jgi:hypothetical protein